MNPLFPGPNLAMVYGNCETCCFWAGSTKERDKLATCFRFPPTPVKARDGYVEMHRPRTDRQDFCGEWRDRDEASPLARED